MAVSKEILVQYTDLQKERKEVREKIDFSEQSRWCKSERGCFYVEVLVEFLQFSVYLSIDNSYFK